MEAGTGGPGPPSAGTEDVQPNCMYENFLTVEISTFFMTGSLNGTTYKESPPGAASWLELVQLFQTSDISPELLSRANGL